MLCCLLQAPVLTVKCHSPPAFGTPGFPCPDQHSLTQPPHKVVSLPQSRSSKLCPAVGLSLVFLPPPSKPTPQAHAPGRKEEMNGVATILVPGGEEGESDELWPPPASSEQ